MSEDITIVTVAGPGDEPYIRANIALMQRMNGGQLPPVFVLDNGKTSPSANGICGALDAIVIDGVPQDTTLPANYRASYQHSGALNHFLSSQKITTRYLLIIDPDFYIVAPDWLRDIPHEMVKHGWAFFGAPWHPQWYNKYRYFPSVHCMFIDTHAIDITTLDFTPELKEPILSTSSLKATQRSLRALLRFVALLTINRLNIGNASDTGYRIYRRYYNYFKHKVGLLQPIMPRYILNHGHLQYAAGRWLETFMPDRFSYIPKKSGYFSEKGFAAKDLPDVNALQWEEFLWQDNPFGFHLRRFSKGTRDIQSELAALAKVLEGFAIVRQQ